MITDILALSPKTLIASGVAVLVFVLGLRWLNDEVKIRQLGGHAKRVKTWLPYGTFSFPFSFLPLSSLNSDVGVHRDIDTCSHLWCEI